MHLYSIKNILNVFDWYIYIYIDKVSLNHTVRSETVNDYIKSTNNIRNKNIFIQNAAQIGILYDP